MGDELPQRRSAFANRAAVAEQEAPAEVTDEAVEKPVPDRTVLMPGHTEPFNPFDRNAWTPERREAQRQRVRQLIAEGRFGGANGFGVKKAKKLNEILAERAQEQADVIIARLDEMLNNKDRRIRLDAIREYRAAEDWAVKNQREEEKHLKDMGEDELDAHLLELIGQGLGLDLSELVFDADVVEDGTELEASVPDESELDEEDLGDDE